MTQMPILITLPPETTCHCPDTTTVRIMRGVGAVVPLDAASAGPWEVWDAVARARLHAVNASHEQAPVFVGTSCLRLIGIHGWAQNPTITIYRPHRRCTSTLPSCCVGSTTVPETSVSCSPFPPLSTTRATVDGLVTEHPYDALVRCALHEDPLEAFVLGCMALNSWSHFSMFHQDECRQRAEEIRATRPGRTGTRVSSRSFNTVGDRSGLRQCCRSRTLMDRSFYLSLHSSHASPHRCSRVSLLCRPPDRGSPHHH